MTIREMRDLGFEVKIPTKQDANQFINMVISTPVVTGGCKTYEEFCKYVNHDFVGETIDFAQQFSMQLLYCMVYGVLEKLDAKIVNDYQNMVHYWKKYNIHFDKIPNRLISVDNKYYRFNDITNKFEEVKGEDAR